MDDECPHPVQVGGLCAVCGQLVSRDGEAGISMMHDSAGVTVSAAEASRLDSESTTRLLAARKLALIVDLDQTIIHATVDPTVAEWARDRSNANFEALRDVGRFLLGTDGKAVLDHDLPPALREGIARDGEQEEESVEAQAAAAAAHGGCWYYVKPRPGTSDFLRSLSERYELHVYTMGTRSYADCVCRLLDPDGSLFGARILSRDENGSLVQKSLRRLFPMDTSMVVIIDDRADVWRWSPNLVKVNPYDFFVGIGDINATFLPTAPSTPAPTTGAAGAVETRVDPTLSSIGSSSSLSSSSSPSPASSSPASSIDPAAGGGGGGFASERRPSAAEVAQEKAADDAAKVKAEESQKVAITEQLGARPLARMQEKLDEKKAAEGSSTPEGREGREEGSTTPRHEPMGASAEESSETASSAEASGSAQPAAAPSASTSAPQPPQEQSPEPPQQAEAPPPPPQVPQRQYAVLRDDDRELVRVQRILDDIHRRWYEDWDRRQAGMNPAEAGKPDVVDIIAELKFAVLLGCQIVFSSVVPLGHPPDLSDLWRLAEEFGAFCTSDLDAGTTHLVTAKPGTAKVNAAERMSGIEIVWPNWLNDSAAKWERQPEMHYRVPSVQGYGAPAATAAGAANGDAAAAAAVASSSAARDAEDAAAQQPPVPYGADALVEMNWAEADDEVDAFLNASGSDDDDDEEDEQSEGYATEGSRRSANAKRARQSSGALRSANSSADEGEGGGGDDGASAASTTSSTRSPLSKRRRVVAERAAAGASRLKQTATASTVSEAGTDDSFDDSLLDIARQLEQEAANAQAREDAAA